MNRTTESNPRWRRRPIGAELAPDGGVHFRVWAPARRTVDVVIDSSPPVALERDGEYFSGLAPNARSGTRYTFRLDGGDAYADPASRFQPEGPHGPSEVVDPSAFYWTDDAWKGAPESPVLYEMHIGTFTPRGTWRGAMERLPDLAALGITMLEVMPIAEFAGTFGWGYDGVNLYAPYHHYGRPDDFRAFVNRAHELRLAVILDVVYNHFGPDGNTVTQFADAYCTKKHHTDWGEAVNFDGPGSYGTREFYLTNGAYWIDEFHLDGVRVDATQNIYDESPSHILRELTDVVRATAAPRRAYVVAENEPQDVTLLRPPARGGYGMDAAWNDDWHHSASVALSGRDEAYYTDYDGRAREFVAAAKFGYLYQGQWYGWQSQPRGVPGLDMMPHQFVHFLENHDQVANSYHGDRLGRLASPRRIRAMTALLLLGPQTPMLFQGQEFGSTHPFMFFADHNEELAPLVRTGRLEFLAQFKSIAAGEANAPPPDPGARSTFERSILDHSERQRNAHVVALHRDLLTLRRDDAVLRSASAKGVDGATLSEDAFLLRYRSDDDDRLLIVNLGRPLHLLKMPEPLLAPPATGRWSVQWSSEDVRYGGSGLPALDPCMNEWVIPGDCAVLLRPTPAEHDK